MFSYCFIHEMAAVEYSVGLVTVEAGAYIQNYVTVSRNAPRIPEWERNNRKQGYCL